MSDPANDALLDEATVREALRSMASELIDQAPVNTIALVGIHRRGVDIAQVLADEIETSSGVRVPTGSLDITLYRDDLMAIGPRPIVGETSLPRGGIEGKVVVLVDDVLFTGRTIRAALDELTDFGRPKRILLAVLVDRGGRELPIHADVVGHRCTVAPTDRVEVLVPEVDGQLAVTVVTPPAE